MSEFPGMDPGFNLPWGAKNAINAPWNQGEPEEADWDDLIEEAEEHEGDLFWEGEVPDRWIVEAGPAGLMLPYGVNIIFSTKWDCIAWLVFEREDWLTEKIHERRREDEIERHYDVLGW